NGRARPERERQASRPSLSPFRRHGWGSSGAGGPFAPGGRGSYVPLSSPMSSLSSPGKVQMYESNALESPSRHPHPGLAGSVGIAAGDVAGGARGDPGWRPREGLAGHGTVPHSAPARARVTARQPPLPAAHPGSIAGFRGP